MNRHYKDLKTRAFIAISVLLVCIACGSTPSKGEQSATAARSTHTKSTPKATNTATGEPATDGNDIPAGARALIKAYPKYIKGYKDNKIQLTDGTEMVYDDGKKKGFTQRLDNSDIEDMFITAYRVPKQKPDYLEDAGRSRCDALFKKMYGASSSQVQSRLANVSWFGQTVKFTTVNGANKQLEKVAAEIAKHPELRKYMKSSGTFYWRNVRGANRMSAHSYGIAFDIAVSYSDYWLWKNPGAKETDRIKYANKIPKVIVEIFQRHGFIWGGAWYHFDTMHFEYRPELLLYAEELDSVH